MLKPVNRYILIEKPEIQEKTSEVLLPEDYAPKVEIHSMYKILDWAEDTRFNLKKGHFIVVDNKMIEEICINNATYFIVQDNYVVGIIDSPMG